MTYMDGWKAISIRIKGLMQAGELHARFLGINTSDSYGRANTLRKQCEYILFSLSSYCDEHQGSLPPDVLAVVRDFITNYRDLINKDTGTPDSIGARVQAALVFIAGLESHVSFLLSDSQAIIRAKSERAFAHLQRSIVADSEFKEKWSKALSTDEVACEKLGATHLLLHGIYAFKVSAEGERTDLVFQDIRNDLADEQRYADGLVLTEWKVAKNDAEAANQFKAAKSQAARYAKGSLGGSELAGYRYLIVVTNDHVQVPPDIIENTVTYRHLNIAVHPRTPSGKKAQP